MAISALTKPCFVLIIIPLRRKVMTVWDDWVPLIHNLVWLSHTEVYTLSWKTLGILFWPLQGKRRWKGGILLSLIPSPSEAKMWGSWGLRSSCPLLVHTPSFIPFHLHTSLSLGIFLTISPTLCPFPQWFPSWGLRKKTRNWQSLSSFKSSCPLSKQGFFL